jgi:hypothetical protein
MLRPPGSGDGKKGCRKCGNRKTLAFFPKDRSKPDGRWHTCRACNREYWAERGKFLAVDRKIREKARHQSRTGLRGLRQYRHPKDAEEFASVPPELRWRARQLLNEYLHRHRHHLTPTLIASLYGCAASNVRRLGDRSWARSLWRKKGYYRSLRKKLEAEAEQAEIRAKGSGMPRVWRIDMSGI